MPRARAADAHAFQGADRAALTEPTKRTFTICVAARMELLQFNACPNDPVIHARGTPLFLSESCHLTGDRRGSLRKSRGETSERLKKVSMPVIPVISCHLTGGRRKIVEKSERGATER